MNTDSLAGHLLKAALLLLLAAVLVRWAVSIVLPVVPHLLAFAVTAVVVSALWTVRRWRRERW
ncbi:MAG TPA: hypothetical protein VNA20_16325 [Frankiaceae bacterium]|nr:hypothetical protein [Frankiaceae bacterium]